MSEHWLTPGCLASQGKVERDVCYEPMKEALIQHFSDIPPEERYELKAKVSGIATSDALNLCRRNFRVLVPGAGLGRLAWDVANLGQ